MNINWRPKDEELTGFIEAYVDSFACWDLVLFMHFNPIVSETANGFSSRIGRPSDEVVAALELFTKLGCVTAHGAGTSRTYSAALTPETRESFARFAHAQDDRELRLMLIRSILARNRE